jgi:glyoxylase-like metal-dependent hydrolase (beta-lactamase superfamily II)
LRWSAKTPQLPATRQHAIDDSKRTGSGLFPGGVGNTQKDAARFDSLYSGVVPKIFDRLPDTTWVYPGHGSDTTLGAERPHLAEWRERGW